MSAVLKNALLISSIRLSRVNKARPCEYSHGHVYLVRKTLAIWLQLSATAAAEDNKKGYDYKPDPFVVEQIANTVIHIRDLRKMS